MDQEHEQATEFSFASTIRAVKNTLKKIPSAAIVAGIPLAVISCYNHLQAPVPASQTVPEPIIPEDTTYEILAPKETPPLVFPSSKWFGQWREMANCLSYAANIPINAFNPGDLAGKRFKEFTCGEIMRALKDDGLEEPRSYDPASCKVECQKGYHPVFAVVGKGDYHFYRKDENTKVWSHKPGILNPTNLDGEGKPIKCPTTAMHTYQTICKSSPSSTDERFCKPLYSIDKISIEKDEIISIHEDNYDKNCGFLCTPTTPNLLVSKSSTKGQRAKLIVSR